MEELELRMYGLVPYNISPIQQGIQFGHGVVEYGLKHQDDNLYLNWANNWKTFIILNGGTTNNSTSSSYVGSMNEHREMLKKNLVEFSEFYEPDLGDQLTSLNFIVDERVFDNKTYPDFMEFLKNEYGTSFIKKETRYLSYEEIIVRFTIAGDYDRWVDSVGGESNAFLKEWLKQFKLA